MKIGRTIYNVVSAFILIALVGLVLLLVGSKLIGFTPYAVLSGSMEPEFPVGSVVYVKEVQADEIEVGDAITFYMSNGSTIVTHQVIEIDAEEELYYTQGIANDAADGTPTSIDNILGKVYLNIPYLGYIAAYITSPPWIYIIVALVLMWIVIMYMVDISKEEEVLEDKKEKKKHKKKYKKRGARKRRRNQ